MAEKDSGDDGPSLEMPSLGFGRKRRKPEPEPVAGAVEPEPVVVEPEPVAQAPAAPTPPPEPEPEPAPTQRLDPVPAAPPAPPLFVDEQPAAGAVDVRDHTDETHAETQTEDEPATGARKQRREFTLPAIGGMAAALVTGVVVGLLTVGATWASLRLCEVVQGTSSCGNPGFFLLLALMIVMILVGRELLKAFGVPDPGSTSFLAMALVAVIAMLFLADLLFSWWMVLALPLVATAAYALSHWVTTAFVDPVESNLHR